MSAIGGVTIRRTAIVAAAALLTFGPIASGVANAQPDYPPPSVAEATQALINWYEDSYADDPAYNGVPTEWTATADSVEVLPWSGQTSRWSADTAYPVRGEVHIVGVKSTGGMQTTGDRGRSDDTVFFLYQDSRLGATPGWSVETHIDDGSLVPR
jgi:hypothetical protein